MTPLSILIPHRGNDEYLEETLGSVLEHRSGDCEILVVLHVPYDDPHNINGEDGVHFLDVSDEPCAMRGLNRAVEMARHPIVHLLASGTTVTEGWSEVACAHFLDPEVAIVAPQILDADRPELAIGLGVVFLPGGQIQLLHRPHVFDSMVRIAPHASASFYRKEALDAIGGFDPSLTLRLAGVDATMAITHAGWRVSVEPNCCVFGRRIAATPQTVYQRALEAERLYWHWAPFGGWRRSLLNHGIRLLRECWSFFPSLRMLPHVAGRIAGLRAIGAHRERLKQLEAAREARLERLAEAESDYSTCFPRIDSSDHSTPTRAAA